MSARIRLQRYGSKKNPSYRVVIIDSRKARNSNPIEYIGFYNPLLEDSSASIKMERLNYWMKCGAKPSERLNSILKRIKQNAAAVPVPAVKSN